MWASVYLQAEGSLRNQCACITANGVQMGVCSEGQSAAESPSRTLSGVSLSKTDCCGLATHTGGDVVYSYAGMDASEVFATMHKSQVSGSGERVS